MNKLIPILIPLTVLGLSACGPHLISHGDDAPAAATAPTTLELQIVAAGTDPGVPGEGDPLMDSSVDAVTQGSVIQWSKRLPFPKDSAAPEIFMEFTDSALGSPIVAANFYLGVMGEENVLKSESLEQVVTHDASRGLWYIPLRRDLGSAVGALDDAQLTLDLQTADGSIREFQIRFSLQIAPPAVAEVKTAGEPLSSFSAQTEAAGVCAAAQAAIQSGQQNGWTIASESYRNPTQAPLDLWFGTPTLDLELDSTFSIEVDWSKFPSSEMYASEEIAYEPGQDQVTRAPLDVFELKLVDSHGNSLTAKADSRGWSRIELPVGETIRADWTVKSSANLSAVAPVATTYPMDVCINLGDILNHVELVHLIRSDADSSRCQAGGGKPGTVPYAANTVLRGYSVAGSWSREVLLGEPGDDVVAHPELAEVLVEKQETKLSGS